jgi:hypothetical protein
VDIQHGRFVGTPRGRGAWLNMFSPILMSTDTASGACLFRKTHWHGQRDKVSRLAHETHGAICEIYQHRWVQNPICRPLRPRLEASSNGLAHFNDCSSSFICVRRCAFTWIISPLNASILVFFLIFLLWFLYCMFFF